MKTRRIPAEVKTGDAATSLGFNLSELVKSVSEVSAPAVPGPAPRRRKSRFFFTLTRDYIASHKESLKTQVVEPVNTAVLKHAAAVKAEVPPQLKQNIEVVRNFIVNELSVLTLALQPGTDQARDVLKQALDLELNAEPFYRFENMAHQAILIRLALFLEEYLQLPKGTAQALLPRSPQYPAGHQHQTNPGHTEPESEGASDGARRSLKQVHRALRQLLDQQGQGAKNDITPSFG